ncbi:hypothetical protein [Streptomyces sp. SM10]|uniref:hypothetical protein n=1 Tax=Streptomyces sp. SM10 TaxID=565556 RepID=UPI000CD50908|nr:hypothetical protein [Streptomyces sp. SM10]
MAWDEWEQIKSDQRESTSTGMQLNQLPADQGGSSSAGPLSPSCASTPAEKKAAADAIDERILTETRDAGKWADEANSVAVKAFGPKDGEGWDSSLRVLCTRLSSESASLRDTGIIFRNNDIGIGTGLGLKSNIDGL